MAKGNQSKRQFQIPSGCRLKRPENRFQNEGDEPITAHRHAGDGRGQFPRSVLAPLWMEDHQKVSKVIRNKHLKSSFSEYL